MPPTLAFELAPNHAFVLLLVGTVMLVPIVGIIAGSLRNAAVARERERTRRELAAYVAEGSMTADEAERILNTKPKRSGGCG